MQVEWNVLSVVSDTTAGIVTISIPDLTDAVGQPLEPRDVLKVRIKLQIQRCCQPHDPSNLPSGVNLVDVTVYEDPDYQGPHATAHAESTLLYEAKLAEQCCCLPSKCKGVASLTLQYIGADPVRVAVFADKKGNKPLNSWPLVEPGDTYTFTPKEGKTKLTKNLHIRIYDLEGNLIEKLKIHTSCSQPLDVGMTFGSVLVTAVDKIWKPSKCKCKGVESLTVAYQGSLSGTFVASKDKKGKKLLPLTIDGDELTITPMTGKKKLSANTYLHLVDGLGSILETQKIHTSCSQPLDVGMTFGEYLVTAIDKIY
jgi:hypothetical protein